MRLQLTVTKVFIDSDAGLEPFRGLHGRLRDLLTDCRRCCCRYHQATSASVSLHGQSDVGYLAGRVHWSRDVVRE